MGRDSLVVRYLIGVLAYFVTFAVLMDVFLMDADFSLILQGAGLFALVVSTISILLMLKKKTRSLSYYDAMFAAGIAGIVLAGAMPADGPSSGIWSFPTMLLLPLAILIGAAGRWVYATMMRLIRGGIRKWSMDGGEV